MRHQKVSVLIFTLLCAGALLLTGCAGGATQAVAPTAALAPESKVSLGRGLANHGARASGGYGAGG